MKLDRPLNLTRVGIDANQEQAAVGIEEEDLRGRPERILFGDAGKDILDATAGRGETVSMAVKATIRYCGCQ